MEHTVYRSRLLEVVGVSTRQEIQIIVIKAIFMPQNNCLLKSISIIGLSVKMVVQEHFIWCVFMVEIIINQLIEKI